MSTPNFLYLTWSRSANGQHTATHVDPTNDDRQLQFTVERLRIGNDRSWRAVCVLPHLAGRVVSIGEFPSMRDGKRACRREILQLLELD